MVNATVGTTVFGAIDPIGPIGDFCEKHDIWFHIDGALAGPAIFTPSLQQLMPRLDRVDSLTIDWHKMLTVPQQSSFIITKHMGLLQEANSMSATYLFMNDRKDYDASMLDTGDKTFQCGRKIDIVKLWLYLQANGMDRIKQDCEKMLSLSQYLAKLVKKSAQFHLIMTPQTTNVCFHYVPSSYNQPEVTDELL